LIVNINITNASITVECNQALIKLTLTKTSKLHVP